MKNSYSLSKVTIYYNPREIGSGNKIYFLFVSSVHQLPVPLRRHHGFAWQATVFYTMGFSYSALQFYELYGLMRNFFQGDASSSVNTYGKCISKLGDNCLGAGKRSKSLFIAYLILPSAKTPPSLCLYPSPISAIVHS